jgi:hypothetical protein
MYMYNKEIKYDQESRRGKCGPLFLVLNSTIKASDKVKKN